jgi:hypothetical protein
LIFRLIVASSMRALLLLLRYATGLLRDGQGSLERTCVSG